jgi:hypothetical protein
MKKLIFILLLFCLIPLIGCTSSEPVIYTIKVSGSSGLEFVGSYGGIGADGTMDMRSVEGTVPRQYTVKASGNVIVSCTFSKLEQSGTLNVFIYRDGELVAQSGTAAAFGMVVLTAK